MSETFYPRIKVNIITSKPGLTVSGARWAADTGDLKPAKPRGLGKDE